MALPEEIYQCRCGYIYSPDQGDSKGNVPAGTRFENLPNDWRCPRCQAGRELFRPLAGPGSVAAESRTRDYSLG